MEYATHEPNMCVLTSTLSRLKSRSSHSKLHGECVLVFLGRTALKIAQHSPQRQLCSQVVVLQIQCLCLCGIVRF
jgi:hypothetical protein